MSREPNSRPENSPDTPDDMRLGRSIRDPLERLPVAPPGLTNLGSAILTRAARPETLALIDKAIAARRRNLEEL
jgi:hypothetical protein